MKRTLTLFFISLVCLESYAQEKPILVFNIENGMMDSIPIVTYDTTIVSDYTNYYLGNFNSTIEPLEQTLPNSNTYPNSNFTFKKQASIDFDLTNYPIRTSVKLFSVENDTLFDLCSGSLISRKHVLTASHCVSFFNSNELARDSLLVAPVFDNGVFNSQLNSSNVTKVYFFRDWNLTGEDFAVLELEEPIGESTGWISIGFNNIDSLLTDGIFYKFSYPATTLLSVDSNEYNGDTLYYNYGMIDLNTDTSLGIYNTSGIPGESGSSLIKVVNEQEYTSYGVLTFSNNLRHSKISNWQFYAFKNIIADDLTPLLTPENTSQSFTIYPNPVENSINFQNNSNLEVVEMTLFNDIGQIVRHINIENLNSGIDVSNLSSGVYYVRLTTNKFVETKKIIKN